MESQMTESLLLLLYSYLSSNR